MDIDKLNIEIQGNSEQAVSGLDKLAATLGRLKNAVNISGMKTLSGNISALAAATKALNQSDPGKVNSIAAALNSLTNIQRGDFGYIVNQVKKIPEVFSALAGINTESVSRVVDALKPLETLQKSNLGSTVTQLKKIPETMALMNNLPDEELAKFTTRVRELAVALTPLANEMQKVANGFSAFPAKLQKAFSATGKANSTVNSAITGLSGKAISWGVFYGYAQRASTVLAECVKESNSYVENLNLFTVAMGEYAQSATKFAQSASDLLGIDPAQFMRYQGVIQQIASGFGLASAKANVLSKNLTQLGYDISSYFNISVDGAMLKLESGIAGELEPLRRIGYALDQATLQQIAYDHGIQQSITSMTQAEKAQLRYLAIMQQSGNVMYDMGRTIMSPANAMRVMQAQIVQLKRAIGDMLIPALTAILPYAIAVVKVMTMAAQAVASFFGFKLPKIDYSSVNAASVAIESVGDVADDVSDKVSGIGKAASDAGKKVRKDLLLTFDELNVISDNGEIGKAASGGGGGGSVGLGDGFGNLALPEYDFTDFASDELKKKVDEITKAMKKWLPVIKTLGTLLVSVWAVTGILKLIARAKELFKILGNKGITGALGKVGKALLGFAAGFAVGYLINYIAHINATTDELKSMANVITGLSMVLGGLLIVLGAVTGNIALVAAGIGVMVGAISGATQAQEQLRIEMMDTEFYNNGGIAISDYTDKVIASIQPITDNANAILDLKEQLDSSKASMDEANISLMSLIGQLQTGAVVLTDEVIQQLSDVFNSFSDTSTTVFSNTQTMVQTHLIDVMSRASESSKADLQSILDSMYLLQANGNAYLAGLSKEANQIIMDMTGMKEGTAEFVAKSNELDVVRQKMVEFSGAASDVDYNWQYAVDNFNAQKLDFKDVDTAKAALDNLSTAGIEAIQAVVDSSGAILEGIDAQIKQATIIGQDVAPLKQYKETVIADRDTQIGEIKSIMQGAFNEIGTQASMDAEAAFSTALGNISLWEKIKISMTTGLGEVIQNGGFAETIAPKLVEEAKGAVDEQYGYIVESLNETANKLGLDKTVLSFGENITSGISTGMESDKMLEKLNSSSGTIIKSAENGIKTNGEFGSPSKKTEKYGKWWVEGFANGIANNGSLLGNSHVSMTDTLDSKLKNYWQFGSPSKKTTQYGIWLLQGLSNGITQNIVLVTNALNRLFSDMQNVFETKKAILTSSMKSIMDSLKKTVEDNSDMSGSFGNMLDNVANKINDNRSVSNAFNNFFNRILEKLDTFTGRFRNAVNDMLSNWQTAMNSVNINSASGRMTYNQMPALNIPRFASGGLPNMGQLFIAGEAGPEIVGSMGGRSFVGNSGQIERVLEKMFVGAFENMPNGGSNQDEDINATIVVNLDGEKIYENQQKIKTDRGYNFGMGGFAKGW